MNKKGFTLVELLAVIAILAILVLVAVPNVLSMFNKAKKDVFLTDAKNVYKEISKKYISESMRGNNISSISNDNNKLDMDTSDLKYSVKLDSKGNITDFQVSNDTYCISGKFNNLGELTTDKITEGKCIDTGDKTDDDNPSIPQVYECTYDGELTQGSEYINGVYTYRYKQSYKTEIGPVAGDGWSNIDTDGWGITLTNKRDTSPVNDKICTSINGKPLVSMAGMFIESRASNIDLNGADTSNVIDMNAMFKSCSSSSINLNNINTSNVTNMAFMFWNTSIESLDLSSFDLKDGVDLSFIFRSSNLKTVYVKNTEVLNKFNDSDVTGKTDLNFIIK